MKAVYLKRFRNNMRFFKKNFPAIYEAIKRVPKDRYELIEQNGKLNVKIDGRLLYPENYEEEVKKRVGEFLKSEVEKFSLTSSKPPKYYDKPLQEIYLNRVVEEFDGLNGENVAKIENMPILYHLIIYGLGLGFHIRELLEGAENIENVVIVERDPAFLSASSYAVDWEEIFKNRRVDFVFDSDPKRAALKTMGALQSVNETFTYRLFFYIHYDAGDLSDYKEELKNIIYEENFKWGFFDDEVVSLKQTLKNIKKRVPVYIPTRKIEHKVPLFVVASGPSLERDVEFIKENRDRAVIFSCGTALRPLLKNGIVPDFEIVIERMRHTYEALLDNATPQELKQIKIVGVNPMYPEVYDLGQKSFMMARYPDSAASLFYEYLNIEKIPFMTPTVTNMALALGISLGFEEIYLFGTDMGFKDLKRHHTPDSVYYKKDSQFKTDAMEVYKQVEPNFGEEPVNTTMIFEMARKSLERLIAMHEATIYNTADGAKIEGAIPKRTQEIELIGGIDRDLTVQEIENAFLDVYDEKFITFTQKRIDLLFERLLDLRKYIKETLYESLDEFEAKEYLKGLTALYRKFEEEIFSSDEMFYILFRGTFYHLISFHYLYFTAISRESDRREYAKRFVEILLEFTQKAHERLKKELKG